MQFINAVKYDELLREKLCFSLVHRSKYVDNGYLSTIESHQTSHTITSKTEYNTKVYLHLGDGLDENSQNGTHQSMI